MKPNNPPFTGKYPTIEQTRRALEDNGFAEDASTTVTSPMDGSTGPLDSLLTGCRSEALSKNYPAMFKAVVKQMIKAARG